MNFYVGRITKETTNAGINHIHIHANKVPEEELHINNVPLVRENKKQCGVCFRKKSFYLVLPFSMAGSEPFTIKNIKAIEKKYLEIKQIYRHTAKQLPLQTVCIYMYQTLKLKNKFHSHSDYDFWKSHGPNENFEFYLYPKCSHNLNYSILFGFAHVHMVRLNIKQVTLDWVLIIL